MKFRLLFLGTMMGLGVWSHHVFVAFILAGVAGYFIGPPQARRKAPVASGEAFQDTDEVVTPAIRGVRVNPDPTRPTTDDFAGMITERKQHHG